MLIKLWLHIALNSDPKDPSAYSLFQCDMAEYGYIKLHEVEIEITPPSQKDYILASVGELKAKQEQLRQTAHNQIEILQQQINSLLALEYVPAQGECK